MSEILKIVEAIKSGKTTARAEVEAAIKRAEADDSNAILEIIRERALERADEIDAKIKAGENVGRLAGVPFVAKDNFLTFGSKTTAASKILEDFEAPVQATAIERLEAEGAICIGKANLDSFAHGGSTENSAFGVTKNAVDDKRVAGGSSGGSAVAVAKGIVPFALGSDTGGSIRQPSSFNGVVGYKPTYGMISRYGVVAMASSTDVVGPIANSVEDVELLCEIMAGQDEKDGTVFPDYFKIKEQKILLVRHGETDWNKEHKIMGRADIELNENGRRQAEKMRDKLADRKFDTIVVSPLLRAKQTAEIIAERHPKTPVVIIDSLIEREFGEYEGRVNDGNYFGLWDFDQEIVGENVESFTEMKKRIIELFRELKKYKDVLIVAHGGIGIILQKVYSGEDKILKNGEFIELKKNSLVLKQVQDGGTKKPKIGLVKQFIGDGVDESVKNATNKFVKKLRKDGYEVDEVDLPMAKYALPIYYIVTPAEISSNMARYDGIRYGKRSSDAKKLAEVYGKSRNEGFVDENKRRIMIGSFVLSSGFFDAYYLQAQKARTLLIEEFNKLYESYDFLIGPVSPTPAWGIGAITDDPIKNYMADIITAPASLAGLPAISIPAGTDENNLPIGVQIIGPMKSDAELLSFAKECEV